ncbi:hypothetical protein B484DRAFT_221937 [Ochromonadaceae sp. CCMP2298]|nr:hypothetical protein B484DRAFT_221937 [Ochromonadaceae sp. CCMP2298]
MDIDAFLNSIPKPIIVLCLLAFFIMKVMWSAVGTGVKTVTSMEDWTGVMEEAGDRLVVVYCHSAYCKMRKTAGALFSQWSKGEVVGCCWNLFELCTAHYCTPLLCWLLVFTVVTLHSPLLAHTPHSAAHHTLLTTHYTPYSTLQSTPHIAHSPHSPHLRCVAEYPGATFVKVYVQTAKLIPEVRARCWLLYCSCNCCCCCCWWWWWLSAYCNSVQ